MKETEKRIIDLTKMSEENDGEQPFMRINYEMNPQENLEAIATNDEVL